MKILGVVVEYNPFHNGHLYHLEEAKKLIRPDVIIAVMSGNFVQRGEPAIINKYARTEMALRSGIDLVLELPVVYSVQDAGGFALGSIWTLNHVGITDLVFGSESNDMELLKEYSHVISEEPDDYLELLKYYLKTGVSFPNARKTALRDYMLTLRPEFAQRIEEIGSSNNILGLEYLNAIKHLNSKIKPSTIQRVGADYNDPFHRGTFTSATAVRGNSVSGNWSAIAESVPVFSSEIMRREFDEGRGPVTLECMEKFLLGTLRTMERADFNKFYGFNEGLDMRFERCSTRTASIQEFLNCIKTRRFTYTRIKRLLMNLLFKIEKELVVQCSKSGPQYLRILGFNDIGREYLAMVKTGLRIPVITTPSLWRNVMYKAAKSSNLAVSEELFREQFKRDILATSLYSLFYGNPSEIKNAHEQTAQVIYYRG